MRAQLSNAKGQLQMHRNDVPTWFTELLATEFAKPADPSPALDAMIVDAFRQARAERESWARTANMLDAL
jgi:hypothetical protein